MTGPRTLRYRAYNGVRAFRRWVIPYLQSRIHPNQFRPILSYLFTDWKCNMACHYCWTYDNSRKGMTLDTAFAAIDWLRTTGCRVIAIMGGEVLLRKDFIVRVVEYGVKRGFFMYVPTNGVLMDPEFVNDVGRAGAATINLALDVIDEKPGLPKAFSRIKENFRYLVDNQERLGYLVFLNMNITGGNLEDIKRLTEIAWENGVSVDYHINERPHYEQKHYRHAENDTYIMPDQFEEADALFDWLCDRQRKGQPMINTMNHLQAMKRFIRGEIEEWHCRAGLNSSAVRLDGTLSPCFGLYSADHDWGSIGEPRFDPRKLNAMKKKCTKLCLSTCHFNMKEYYTGSPIRNWVKKHAETGGGGL